MNETTEWSELSYEAGMERRREKRVALAFPIEVSGLTSAGRHFAERTQTISVSASGCAFHLKTELKRGASVAIKVVRRDSNQTPPGNPLLFQIARVEREEDGWVMGAIKLQPENLWCVAFPAPVKQLTPVA